MDMTASIAPKSDQLNADDLMAAPVTVTIGSVTEGTAEQPFNFHLVEYPSRAYRPSKSMRRVMTMAWGADPSKHVGHSLTLFRNPDITFGREKTGGIEISHMSHIEKAFTIALTKSKGKRAPFTVKPLIIAAPTPPRDESGRNWLNELKLAANDLSAIAALGTAANTAHAAADTVEIIRARYKELKEEVGA